MNNLKVDTIVVCCDMNGRCLQNSGVCCCDIANRSRLLSDGPAGEHISPDDGECFTREVQSNPTTPHSDTVPGYTQDTALEQGAISRVFKNCMKAEQQTSLMRALKKNKVGTGDIEEHYMGQVKARKVKKE